MIAKCCANYGMVVCRYAFHWHPMKSSPWNNRTLFTSWCRDRWNTTAYVDRASRFDEYEMNNVLSPSNSFLFLPPTSPDILSNHNREDRASFRQRRRKRIDRWDLVGIRRPASQMALSRRASLWSLRSRFATSLEYHRPFSGWRGVLKSNWMQISNLSESFVSFFKFPNRTLVLYIIDYIDYIYYVYIISEWWVTADT